MYGVEDAALLRTKSGIAPGNKSSSYATAQLLYKFTQRKFFHNIIGIVFIHPLEKVKVFWNLLFIPLIGTNAAIQIEIVVWRTPGLK